jgi:hypothetical protein
MSATAGPVTAALVSVFTAGLDASAVEVFPAPAAATRTAPSVLLVGSDGDSAEQFDASYEPADLGPDWQQERVDVPCLIQSHSGDSVSAARDLAVAALAACRSLLSADPTLGGAIPEPVLLHPHISRVTARAEQGQGVRYDALFTVTYITVLTS